MTGVCDPTVSGWYGRCCWEGALLCRVSTVDKNDRKKRRAVCAQLTSKPIYSLNAKDACFKVAVVEGGLVPRHAPS